MMRVLGNCRVLRTSWTLAAIVAVAAGLTWAAEPDGDPKAAKPPVPPPQKPAPESMPPAAGATTTPAAKSKPVNAPPLPDDDPGASDPVEMAIRKAVDHLKKLQKGDNWEMVPRRTGDEAAQVAGAQWGGLTSMATYALLAAGESPQSAPVAKALAFLDKADVIGTYAMGMKLQVWNYIERPNPAQKDTLRKDATLLLNGVKTGGVATGLYHYWLDPAKGDYDMSTSNYGVLGMWAASQQNLEVPSKYWEFVDKAWRKMQQKDGGWVYQQGREGGSTISMTGAGVATLFITQDMLNEGKGGDCKGNVEDKDIDRGLKWLSDNYAKLGGNMYAMYNIERVGTASGYKYFGTTDWYKSGAAHLVKTQAPDGSWPGGHGASTIPGTVWGILFLVKGRAPVMMNKLDYAFDGKAVKAGVNWNQRPRDVANLARWAGHELEKELNWQIVNLKVDIEDLHDAPVLYVSGNQPLNFAKDDEDKLRQYVEGGGMILGHADCGDPKFSAAFAKLAQKLFPACEFRDLPQDHLIYNAHFNLKEWAGRPTLKGISNGARELMVLIPTGDPARYWQIRNFGSNQTRPLAQLATNIYLYALDKSALKNSFKGHTYIVKRDPKAQTSRKVKVARLNYGGGWDPEPGGWRRLANDMHNSRGIELAVEPVKLGDGKLTKDFQVAHLTGAAAFDKFTDAQRKELKAFVDNGGTLVVDAAGGAVSFKESAEAELKETFGDAARAIAAPLPLAHGVFSAGEKLHHVAYRAFVRKSLGSGINTPRLRGIEINNRTAVFYSQEDLSVGLVGMPVDGIYGYDPASATDLMANIITYATGGPIPKAPPATAPATPKPPKPEGEHKPEMKKPDPKKNPKP